MEKRSEGAGWCGTASTYLSVTGKALDESLLPVNLFEDDQTLPSFAFVVRCLLMVALKEQSFTGNSRRVRPEQENGKIATYSSSSGRNLKTEETESSGVLWYYAMRGYFS